MGSPTLSLSHIHEKPYKVAKDKIRNTRRLTFKDERIKKETPVDAVMRSAGSAG